jgi:hypothetical protein
MKKGESLPDAPVEAKGKYPGRSIIAQEAVAFLHLTPGTFLKNTTPGKAYTYSYAMLTYDF